MDAWDWNKMLRDQPINQGEMSYVHLEIIHNGKNVSRKIAVEWDGIAKDGFYYRDWTKSSLPFLEGSTKYWSGFWFETLEDAQEFQKRYGGVGDWQEGYQEFVYKCNQERNS